MSTVEEQDDGAPPEQTELNLGTGPASAMSEAVAGAVQAATAPDGVAPAPEVIAAARKRAAKMLEGLSSEDAAGLRDLNNLSLSIGLPATRALFRHMISASDIRGQAKIEARQAVNDFSPVTEHGCLQVDFHDRSTGQPGVAYLTLRQCPAGHNLDRQLRRLKARVAEEKWPEVLRALSALVHIGRTVYVQTARQNTTLLRRLAGDRAAEYAVPKVDPRNTTLYLDPAWPNRVGIHVQLSTPSTPGPGAGPAPVPK